MLIKPQSRNAIIGAKWVFRNKLDKQVKIVRNKVRLVAKGYFQQEDIDYTKMLFDYYYLLQHLVE